MLAQLQATNATAHERRSAPLCFCGAWQAPPFLGNSRIGPYSAGPAYPSLVVLNASAIQCANGPCNYTVRTPQRQRASHARATAAASRRSHASQAHGGAWGAIAHPRLPLTRRDCSARFGALPTHAFEPDVATLQMDLAPSRL